jgi:hypothetical protein
MPRIIADRDVNDAPRVCGIARAEKGNWPDQVPEREYDWGFSLLILNGLFEFRFVYPKEYKVRRSVRWVDGR